MATVGYCRVSTEEQAAEGVSLAGQAERIRQLARLREVGEPEIIEDAGWSAKTLERPGMKRLLERICAGEVEHLLVWRLDRLTRDVGDFQHLVELFAAQGVNVHSVSETVDLSSASGRMQANILGVFAQYYREQLAENVRMGMEQAMGQGRHVNRAKFGYRMVDGALVPEAAEAAVVQAIFGLRSEGKSYRAISDETGVNYGTVMSIVKSRVYLGEIPHLGEWLPGAHEPILRESVWQAAQRTHLPGRRRARHFLAGRVRCGLCGRSATVKDNGDGRPLLFRCWHRGTGCRRPARSSRGLERAAVFGLRILREDVELRQAIRDVLARDPDTGSRARARRETAIQGLERNRRKLLDAYYAGRVSDSLLGQEEQRFAAQIDALRGEQASAERQRMEQSAVRDSVEGLFAILDPLDVDAIWQEATAAERRVLVEDLIEAIWVLPRPSGSAWAGCSDGQRVVGRGRADCLGG